MDPEQMGDKKFMEFANYWMQGQVGTWRLIVLWLVGKCLIGRDFLSFLGGEWIRLNAISAFDINGQGQ